ncbi:MAG: ral secretion pathway protein [Methylobacteriaceae bacterium]|nr:ral secretion pathway protein [Methylobacteriaceae bacterium]
MSARGKRHGFIIVAVLWMIAALAVLAAIYTRFALTTAVAASVHEDRLRAEGLISAAAELTAYQLTATLPANRPSNLSIAGSATAAERTISPGAEQMPTRGAFSFRLGRAGVTVEYQSEAARIDLNMASTEMLAGLFRTLGAEPDNANYYGDRIIGWRKKGEVAGENEEATAYRVAGIAYKPRQAPFQSTAELWLVLGIPEVLKERALPFLTVYSGQTDVDAENAAPEVVASLPNMTPERLGEVLQKRASPTQFGQAQSAQPGANQKPAGPPAQSFRLNIRLALENGRRVRAEVVILVLQDGDEPYRVLSWRDDFDGTS